MDLWRCHRLICVYCLYLWLLCLSLCFTLYNPTDWSPRIITYLLSCIGCRFSKELLTSCVCSCTRFTTDKHHNACQTVYPQFLQPVTDTGWGWLAQRSTFCLEQEADLENMVFSTPVRPLGTLCLLTFTTLLIAVLSENDSRVYFLIVLTTYYCWCSWWRRTNSVLIDWLIDNLTLPWRYIANIGIWDLGTPLKETSDLSSLIGHSLIQVYLCASY